jgi:hypothetical protein
VKRIIQLASDYGRYGYRRVTALLRGEGWPVNHKRVERLWRQEGLKVPMKQPKRRRWWLADGSCVRLRPTHIRGRHVATNPCSDKGFRLPVARGAHFRSVRRRVRRQGAANQRALVSFSRSDQTLDEQIVTVARGGRNIVRITREQSAMPQADGNSPWSDWPKDAPPPAVAPFDDEQAKQHQQVWASYLGVPVEIVNSLGMKLRIIPP